MILMSNNLDIKLKEMDVLLTMKKVKSSDDILSAIPEREFNVSSNKGVEYGQ